jgi:hypothetical protein
MGIYKEESGNVYGKLTALYRDSKNIQRWMCKCECGNVISVLGNSLRSGYTRSCGCSFRKNELSSGDTFGHLTVIKESKEKRYNSKSILWECQCGCGNTVLVSSTELIKGKRKRCNSDCVLYGIPPGAASFNCAYAGMIKGARVRGYSWDIDKDIFRKLTSSNCYYCGTPPSQLARKGLNGDYLYNGLDRVDNSKGYSEDNCVPCCGRCNKAKGTMSLEEFLELVSLVYSNRILK